MWTRTIIFGRPQDHDVDALRVSRLQGFIRSTLNWAGRRKHDSATVWSHWGMDWSATLFLTHFGTTGPSKGDPCPQKRGVWTRKKQTRPFSNPDLTTKKKNKRKHTHTKQVYLSIFLIFSYLIIWDHIILYHIWPLRNPPSVGGESPGTCSSSSCWTPRRAFWSPGPLERRWHPARSAGHWGRPARSATGALGEGNANGGWRSVGGERKVHGLCFYRPLTSCRIRLVDFPNPEGLPTPRGGATHPSSSFL